MVRWTGAYGGLPRSRLQHFLLSLPALHRSIIQLLFPSIGLLNTFDCGGVPSGPGCIAIATEPALRFPPMRVAIPDAG